jgi:CheY-like chemotaxis protein
MAQGFNYQILVVDDEPSIRQTATLLLSSKGYEVQVAEDGFAALVLSPT